MSADEDLVRRCLRGDPEAIRSLVDRFQDEVLGLCVRLLNHRHDAEDVTQEVFLRVFRSLGRWDSTRPLRPWVLTIAVNRCRTWIGRRAKLPEPTEFLHDIPDRAPLLESTELSRAIQEILLELRAEYREVFVLFHEHGQAYEDIANVVDRPVGTVKTWLHRARSLILDSLKRRGLVPNESPESDPDPTRAS